MKPLTIAFMFLVLTFSEGCKCRAVTEIITDLGFLEKHMAKLVPVIWNENIRPSNGTVSCKSHDVLRKTVLNRSGFVAKRTEQLIHNLLAVGSVNQTCVLNARSEIDLPALLKSLKNEMRRRL